MPDAIPFPLFLRADGRIADDVASALARAATIDGFGSDVAATLAAFHSVPWTSGRGCLA